MTRSALLLSVLLVVPTVRAQSPASDSLPTFEVASVKPRTGGRGSAISPRPGGAFFASNVTTRRLIRSAYGLQGEYQIVGGPAWLDVDRFDVNARAAAADTPPAHVYLMLRSLLVERFKLVAHTESRRLPAYLLVQLPNARISGQGLRPVDVDCEALARAARAGRPIAEPGPTAPRCQTQAAGTTLRGFSVTMANLVAALNQRQLDGPVVDGTGLPGRFDFVLEWAPEEAGAANDRNLPTLPIALEEQLGLRLESRQTPVDVLVIDSVSPPTPD